MTTSGYIVSAILGACWALVACLAGEFRMSPPVWASVTASPFIGILMGHVGARFWRTAPPRRVAIALLTLYLATALFGFAADVRMWIDGAAPRRFFMENAYILVWGVTWSGWVIFFWPLAYLSHTLVDRIGTPQVSAG